VFRRRRSAGLPLAVLLENYLVRAEAIADDGGGDLWVAEPSVPAELLPEFTEAVVLFLAEHGVDVDDVDVLDGTATARLVVLAAEFDDDLEGELGDKVADESEDQDEFEDQDEDEFDEDEEEGAGLDEAGDEREPLVFAPFGLRPAEVTPPAPRRPILEHVVEDVEEDEEDIEQVEEDVERGAVGNPDDEPDPALSVVDLAYKSRSAR
jgi:hypothetical protein